jgi:dihydrofolate reductase
MRISLIAAMASNRVIGQQGTIPWHIPGEQKLFKQITIGHTAIMGRKTYESIGKPFPERFNIIITRQNDYQAPGCVVAGSLEDALNKCPENEDEVFICGGGQLYTESIAIADRLYLSILNEAIQGDTYFPEFSEDRFQKIHSEHIEAAIPYTYTIFERHPREKE